MVVLYITITMKQNPSSGANNSSASKEFQAFYWTWRFNTVCQQKPSTDPSLQPIESSSYSSILLM